MNAWRGKNKHRKTFLFPPFKHTENDSCYLKAAAVRDMGIEHFPVAKRNIPLDETIFLLLLCKIEIVMDV